ncbi:MAG: DNA replication/repair protein RecF [Clostridia bacterium]|nr:DNA replication/repair protein RecF [Clostridia bacterium]
MRIEILRLRDFRNYESAELRPHPGVNLIFGRNGSGKTNLLEAVHYCALGKSHRLSSDREAVRRGAESGACGVTVVTEGGIRTDIALRISASPAEKRKTVFIGRKKAPRIAELMGHVRCVMFSPEDLQLVREGPALRRRFTDMLLCQTDPVYYTALQRYNRALELRNLLLREIGPDPGQLRSYEELMAEAAAAVIPRRAKALAPLAAIAEEKYRAVSAREGETFTMAYVPCADSGSDNLRDLLLDRWKKDRDEDRIRKGTGFGPHREDIRLRLNGRDMKVFASQGQVRTAALAMKLGQLKWIRGETGETPVLLLDDVMSELDMERRTRLLDEISGAQTFITCTDETDLNGLQEKRTYRVWLEGEHARVEETRQGAKSEQPAPEIDLDEELGN